MVHNLPGCTRKCQYITKKAITIGYMVNILMYAVIFSTYWRWFWMAITRQFLPSKSLWNILLPFCSRRETHFLCPFWAAIRSGDTYRIVDDQLNQLTNTSRKLCHSMMNTPPATFSYTSSWPDGLWKRIHVDSQDFWFYTNYTRLCLMQWMEFLLLNVNFQSIRFAETVLANSNERAQISVLRDLSK